MCYLNGNGVAENAYEAVKWFRKAAKQGDANAQNMLGMCYLNGNGVAEDENKAFSWCMKAARQELPVAMYNIGSFFEDGQGCDCDYEKALEWYEKAKNAGFEDAEEALERISSEEAETFYDTSKRDCNNTRVALNPDYDYFAKKAEEEENKSGIRKFMDGIIEGIDDLFS